MGLVENFSTRRPPTRAPETAGGVLPMVADAGSIGRLRRTDDTCSTAGLGTEYDHLIRHGLSKGLAARHRRNRWRDPSGA